jgi:hypothetical protein
VTGSGCLKPNAEQPLNRATQISTSKAAGVSDEFLNLSIILASNLISKSVCHDVGAY